VYNLYARNGDEASGEIGAWIDWNADGDFVDSLEHLGEVSVYSGDTALISFKVPNFASTQLTRLRVRESYSSQFGPCDSLGYGEAEDYSVYIGAIVKTPEISFNRKQIKVYPNPIYDIAKIEMPNSDSGWKISIIDNLGKLVYADFTNLSKYTFNSNGIQSGVYFLKIYNDNNQHITRIVLY
jgi:hypothetical protein